jgi:2-polyprenyl-3-methyl-5-hydroxy-6-metoxy-1,4-benzoquinol methylase
VWEKTSSCDKNINLCIEEEKKSLRCKKIISYLGDNLGALNGLKSIEVGSGGGIYSLILAQRGFKATLLDYCDEALSLAGKNFNSLNLSASFVCLDAFNLSRDLIGAFDVAMSFGTIEHYKYPDWLKMAKAHFDLVRPGGVVVISVPNRWFLPMEALQFYLESKGKWELGYTKSFTPLQLYRTAKEIGLKNFKIQGSDLIADIFNFISIVQGTRTFKKYFKIQPKYHSNVNLTTPLDSLFGADIFLMGRK